MYLGQKDEKVHQFVLIKIKASIIIIRDRSIFHYYSNPFNCKYVKQRNHSIFRHDNFIGCFSADKIKMPARKYFCFNIPVYKNMVEESSCRSPYHEEYIRIGASGNPEGLCH